ncbi:hypothetical protein GQ602_004680 [Ophiocordyceps camponoti-floridani]|uniref:Uncharacterized protein n=1 Tax=Ophiocordyceps camponoti-floridani TaxID=2030778 RepID=A0A8H4VC98_9HYPO|nr:hypothetical protein GQ602_004680 [Ophiocordyceps camponoti-floridani]
MSEKGRTECLRQGKLGESAGDFLYLFYDHQAHSAAAYNFHFSNKHKHIKTTEYQFHLVPPIPFSAHNPQSSSDGTDDRLDTLNEDVERALALFGGSGMRSQVGQ